MKNTIDNPNSLLVRWNGRDGQFQGAQCTRFYAFEDEVTGRETNAGESGAIPVGEAVAGGFPLAAVISELTTSLLVAVEAKDAEIVALKAAAKPAEEALAAANAQVAALTEQLAAYTNAPPTGNVSRKQIKVALEDSGWLDSFETLVRDPQDGAGNKALISWEEDESFNKTSPVMALVLGRMKRTDKEIDALFVAAAKL